ncbi:MAG: sugar phosphate isomerase/epimerase [Acidobacteriota bacterium]|nr:sugar phosphate isomerase/epimerase [Acidobacteriota bacterium]
MPIKTTLLNRRGFMQLTSLVCAAGAVRPALGQSPAPLSSKEFPIRIGRVVWVAKGQTADAVIGGVRELGLSTCQIGFDDLSVKDVAPLHKALHKYGVEVTAISEHNPGPRIFDFYHGPSTIGIIPPATRDVRVKAMKVAADVATLAGIPAIHAHCGFIPEDPNDPIYPQAVAVVKDVAAYCKERHLMLLCETGQETPITMVRLIEDVKLGNVFVNLDVANLILYGKGNPVDAMDVFGDRVRGIHAKDGHFPTNPRNLGTETAIGKGKVDFPGVFRQLKKANYTGSMMIEREIGNEEDRRRDILHSKALLEKLIAETYS